MQSAVLGAFDHYAYAVVAVVGTFLAVWACDWLLRRSRWAAWCVSWQGVVPPFINILGMMFGLTLAFLANDTWSAHDRAINAVYREADALRTLAALSAPLPEPQRLQLRQAMADYGQTSADEWSWLAQRTQHPDMQRRADALMIRVAAKDVREALGDTVQKLMLDKVSEMRRERDLRVSLSQTHVNPLKWLGMAFLGLLTLLSVAVVHVDKPRAALMSIMLFACGAAPTAAIVLIQGNPFLAPTAVTPEPILSVLPALRPAP